MVTSHDDPVSRLESPILDHLLEGCQVIGPAFTYLYVNEAAARHGRTTKEALLGRTMMEAFPGIERTPLFEALRKCMEDGTPFELENEFTFPDGTNGWFELRLRRVPIGVFILSMDMTKRKSVEEQLSMAQRLESIGRLAGGVAHDFNNILSVILAYSGFAAEGLREGDPLRDDIEEIRKAGHRAATLTRQLLAFSRKQVLQPEVLCLNRVLAAMEPMLRRLIGEDLDLRMRLDPKLGNAKVDPGQIEQVVMNLVVNARDALPGGGWVTVETANVELDEAYAAQHLAVKPGSFVMLSVSDDGTGMDEATRAKIFEPFFTTKEAGKGTGLGLSTVFGIVKQSGGSIWVYSELGKGTTFKLYFPRDLTATEATTRPTGAPTRATGDETILVVEDEEAVRNAAKRILAAVGYTVLTAANGGEALLLCEARREPIHLMLTDVVMPAMNGRELAQRLALVHPELKVVFMSGYTDDAITQHGVLDSSAHLVNKPFNAVDLTRKVREVLDAPATGASSD